MQDQWVERKRPVRMERRYEFDSYMQLRDFLDDAAEISETHGYYPDMGFGKDYLNVTIHAEEGAETFKPEQLSLSEDFEQLYRAAKTTEAGE